MELGRETYPAGVERRIVRHTQPIIEMRGTTTTQGLITGYPALFNTWSQNLGGFREQIAPGAFAETLRKRADVRLLINHDGIPLARTTAGTLRLKEDTRGLWMEAEPPTWAAGLLESVQRGDITQCSFAFVVIRDLWEWGKDPDTGKDTDLRTLLEVELRDVSVVTYPAYTATWAKVAGDTTPARTTPAQTDASQARLELMRQRTRLAEITI